MNGFDRSTVPEAGRDDARQRVAIVANRLSGGSGADLDGVQRCLEERGFLLSISFSDEPSGIVRLVEEAAAAADIVVVAGGDGTLSAAIPAFLKSGRTMGILPLGTANDLARSLGIPFDLAEAAAVIVDGAERWVDVGVVNGRPFFNAASIGLSAEVALRHTGERKRRLGVLNYPLLWWEAFRASRPFPVQIGCDGEQRRCRCMMLTVGNGRHHGAGMTIDEDAQIDDGLLKIYYVQPAGVWGLLRAFVALRRGMLRRTREGVLIRCRRASIATRRRMPINIDGDVSDWTPAEFHILPRALRILAPRIGPGL